MPFSFSFVTLRTSRIGNAVVKKRIEERKRNFFPLDKKDMRRILHIMPDQAEEDRALSVKLFSPLHGIPIASMAEGESAQQKHGRHFHLWRTAGVVVRGPGQAGRLYGNYHSLVHSHWSSSYITALSLVQSFPLILAPAVLNMT